MIHRALRMLESAHLDLREHLFVREQLDVDVDDFAHVEDTLLHGGITDHGVGEDNRIRLVQHEFVVTVFVGRSADGFVGVKHDDIRQFDTDIVLIDDVAIHTGAARVRKNATRAQQQKVYYF